MWSYKIPSLEEKALAQVAINLCQENGLKEVAMRLDKPTYGGLIGWYAHSFFVSDPQKLSIWAKVKDDDQLCDDFMKSCYMKDDNTCEKVRRWDAAVDEQCERLTEGIPNLLKQKIHPWINRIALEYFSYSRRQEVLFGVSRYFLMNIFTRGDWKEAGRLDEEKLAQRLLEDGRLTVLQRYRIACVYCLHIHILQLWDRLTQEEKQFTSGYSKLGLSQETHSLVLLWSRYMNANPEEKVALREDYLWTGISQAITSGNRAALMVCWKEFQEDIRQKMVIDRALECLRQWQSMLEFRVKMSLVSHQSPEKQSAGDIKDFNLPSYYSELIHFFLSQMDQEQQLTFFKKAFQRKYRKSLLECFLDWPHQDNFLPMINRLWGIIPKDTYGECLLALASKYSENDIKTNCDYDYRSLLRALWEDTPEEYKQYVFCDSITHYLVIKKGEKLLSRLLERSPFQEKDEALFKRIFRDQPQEKRRAMMLSEEGVRVCSLLMQKEKWSFLNGLLEECLLKEEIPNFKKRFIRSDRGVQLCLDALKKNRERLVEELLDWSLESDADKTQSKYIFFENDYCSSVCKSLLRKGKFTDVERVINFCLPSDEEKERFKVRIAKDACDDLLDNYATDPWSEDSVWEQMDTIIAWSVDTEEKIRDFKKDLFSYKGPVKHDRLVFIEGVWRKLERFPTGLFVHCHLLFIFFEFFETPLGKVERFYQWFDLSPEEIKQLKRDTVFTRWIIEEIDLYLPEDANILVDSLRWCLIDEEMVIDFQKKVEERYFTEVLDERKKKEQLDHLLSELLDGFRKEEVQDKTGREGVSVKDTGEKRSSEGMEDESDSPRRQRKSSVKKCIMWFFLNKISSLEEKALAQVAINLCQENGFKEVALRLEKPTYGGFVGLDAHSYFVSDPEKLSIWAKVKEDDRLCSDFISSWLDDTDNAIQWNTAINEQCQRLKQEIPYHLRQNIHPWMYRAALEYLSYSRRQEVLFGISRYLLMNIFTREDWKETARLDEQRLAQRLLEDERLTVLQRYRIACVYCLHIHIFQLWERLSQEEKQFTSGDGKLGLSQETHSLVLLWSRYMNANPEEKVALREDYLWTTISEAISYGNCAALMMCWKEFQEDVRQKMVIDRALECLRQWQTMGKFYERMNSLVSYQLPEKQSADTMKNFNLPSYYSKLMFFFLSQANEEQQLTFFKKAFQTKYRKSVLGCFLEWPHQDNFLPTINQLWGIIPKDNYGQCLLALARKYCFNHLKKNCHYDYRSLLRALWEETPEEYKQYVFCDRKADIGLDLLVWLSARSHFQEKDEVVFKRIFRDQPQEERRAMMFSEEGVKACSLLMEKEKLSFVNGLLEEWLSKEEIRDFKTRFIQSKYGVSLFSDALEKNRENLVENLFDWSFESEAEKMRYKDELIENNHCLHALTFLLRAGKFADVKRVINFCLSSDEKKGQFKVHLAQFACSVLLEEYTYDYWSEDCVWKQMDTIIAWSVDTEERIRDFKKDLFSRERIHIHDCLVFVERMWGKVEPFYQWFDLSPEEIKQLKRDTVFTTKRKLCNYSEFVASLRWCLTDEEMVIDFKKEVEEYCIDILDERGERKEQLDRLVSELLDGFRKEYQDKTSREGVGEKRSSVWIEDEFSSTRK